MPTRKFNLLQSRAARKRRFSADRRVQDHRPQGAGLTRKTLFTLGRYHVLQQISRDEMTVVYLAHDPVLRREVLLRSSHNRLASEEQRQTVSYMLMRDAKTSASIRHPNIVSVVDFGTDEEGRIYIVMVPGENRSWHRDVTLERAIQNGIGIGDALRAIVDVLKGLAEVHDRAIVHRDVRPMNILLLEGGGAELMGFGLVRLLPEVPRSGKHRSLHNELKGDEWSQTGLRIGTMSPEQVMGKEFDGRADLFAAGCIVYGLVAGRSPFKADNPLATSYKIIHEEPDMALIPSAPEWQRVNLVVRDALQKDPGCRYPRAISMSIALDLAIRDLGGEAKLGVACTDPQDLPTGPPLPWLNEEPEAEDSPKKVH